MSWMTRFGVLIFLVLASTMSFAPTREVLSAEEISPIQVQFPQQNQAVRQGQVLEGTQAVRPSLKERDAVN